MNCTTRTVVELALMYSSIIGITIFDKAFVDIVVTDESRYAHKILVQYFQTNFFKKKFY